MAYGDGLWCACGVGFILRWCWDWFECSLNPEGCSAGEPARSPFVGTRAVWGHNPREAVASRRKKLPGASSWGSERPRRVHNWGFPWQQAQGSCEGKKGRWRTENASERQREELKKAVPRVGAGSQRSTWPWAADLTPSWGHAKSWERGLPVVPEGREMAGGPGWICRAAKGVKVRVTEALGASRAPEQRAEGSCDAHISLGTGPWGGELLASMLRWKVSVVPRGKELPFSSKFKCKG